MYRTYTNCQLNIFLYIFRITALNFWRFRVLEQMLLLSLPGLSCL